MHLPEPQLQEILRLGERALSPQQERWRYCIDRVAMILWTVHACNAPATFQVKIDSTLETFVPGKPGGVSKPLQTHYLHVREIKDGYLMVSASTNLIQLARAAT